MADFGPEMLTGAQIRAARALLGISAARLAEMTRLGVATIRRSELDDGPVTMTIVNAERVIAAFDAAGVEFIARDGAGVGVLLK